MQDKKIIIMFTYSPFPFGSAVSNRIFSLALTFKDAGYRVIVLSNGGERDIDFDSERKSYFYKTIEYRSFAAHNNRIIRVYNRNNIFGLMKKYMSQKEIDSTRFLYTTYRNYGLILKFILKNYFKIPVIVDVTEWHSSDQYKFGKLNLSYLFHNLKFQFILPKAKNIICITSFLEKEFKKKHCNTVIVPPQVDINNFLKHKTLSKPPLKLFYAGTLAKKDYLDVALDGLCMLSPNELKNIKCTLVGQDINEFIIQFPKANIYLEVMKDSLEVLNRIPKPEVDKKLSEEHFLILMRPDSQYSKAGFPSKVPESLAAGVPVMTNYTSDLRKYIVDGTNGIVVKSFSPEAFANAVREALKLQEPELKKMSESAFDTAVKYFNYDVHTDAIKEFVEKCEI
ncbi:MAG: glycosyltransferase [Acidaminococcaceae bacterium]